MHEAVSDLTDIYHAFLSLLCPVLSSFLLTLSPPFRWSQFFDDDDNYRYHRNYNDNDNDGDLSSWLFVLHSRSFVSNSKTSYCVFVLNPYNTKNQCNIKPMHVGQTENNMCPGLKGSIFFFTYTWTWTYTYTYTTARSFRFFPSHKKARAGRYIEWIDV